jgi:preprotein translocase subunit SecG
MMFLLLKGSLIFVEILTSILLIGIILLQRSKSQGPGGMAFGVGVGETIFGSQAGNVLTRATIVLGTIFLLNTAALSFLYTTRRQTSVVDRTAPANQPVPRPSPQPMAPPPMEAPMSAQPAAPAVPAPTIPPSAAPAPVAAP